MAIPGQVLVARASAPISLPTPLNPSAATSTGSGANATGTGPTPSSAAPTNSPSSISSATNPSSTATDGWYDPTTNDGLPYGISFVDGQFAPSDGSTSGTVVFDFSGGGQSVVTSNFSTPCVPSDPSNPSSFWSGPMGMYDQFVINGLPADQTIFFYSPNGNDCANGVVGVINPNGTRNLAAYVAAAAAFTGVAGVPVRAPYGGYVIRDDTGGWATSHAASLVGTLMFFMVAIGLAGYVLYRAGRRKLAQRQGQNLDPGGGLMLSATTRPAPPADTPSQNRFTPWKKLGVDRRTTVEAYDGEEDGDAYGDRKS